MSISLTYFTVSRLGEIFTTEHSVTNDETVTNAADLVQKESPISSALTFAAKKTSLIFISEMFSSFLFFH